MLPYLLRLDGFALPTYGSLYLTAFLVAIFTISWLARRHYGVPFGRMVDICFLFAIAGEVGSRLTFLLVEWPQIRSGAISWKQFLTGGRVVLGGVFAGTLTAAYLFRRHRLPVFPLLDVSAVGLTLGMGIGRLACLAAGCCYGKPTTLLWGIIFTDPAARRLNGTPLGVPLHPTQILQALDGFALFALLLWLLPRRKFEGQLFALFFLLEGVSRFAVEFLRGDPRGGALGLATSQWIGLAMALAGAFLWARLSRRPAAAAPAH